MDYNNLKIINQLVDARVNSGYTQEAFARKLGMKKSNHSRIESGNESVSFDTLIKMIKAYTYYVNLRTEFPNPDCDIYVLKQYDFELLSFKFIKGTVSQKGTVKIISINNDLKRFLPQRMKPTNNSLYEFLKKRSIPKNRKYVEEILNIQNLSLNDVKGIIDVSMGLSLNDPYWITKLDFKGKYKDYNLYENDFSTALALVAYTGLGSSHIAVTTSPEFTTNGMLPKAWRRLDNKVYLFKGSSSSKNEPYVEYYASKILDALNLYHISYDLDKWKGKICSKCELFTSLDVSYVPIKRFINYTCFNDIFNFAKQYGENIVENLKSMFVFDALICNVDRHLGNFGFLVDNKTNKIIGLAPIFDNGNSLFYNLNEKQLINLEKKAKTLHNPFGISNNEILKYCLGQKQKDQLARLQNFKFDRNSQYSWSEKRLTIIEDFLKNRVNEFLKY